MKKKLGNVKSMKKALAISAGHGAGAFGVPRRKRIDPPKPAAPQGKRHADE